MLGSVTQEECVNWHRAWSCLCNAQLRGAAERRNGAREECGRHLPKSARPGEFYERALGNDAGGDVTGSEKPRVGHQSRSTWRRGPQFRNSTARVQCASPFPTPGRAVRKASAAAAFPAARALTTTGSQDERNNTKLQRGDNKQYPPTEPQEHQRAKSELPFTTDCPSMAKKLTNACISFPCFTVAKNLLRLRRV